MGCGASAQVADLESKLKTTEESKKKAEQNLQQAKDSASKEQKEKEKLQEQLDKLQKGGGGGGGGTAKELIEVEDKLKAAEVKLKEKESEIAKLKANTIPAATVPSSKLAAANGASGLRIVLLGPPASGKGKQADLILQHFKLAHISPGVVLREASQADTTLGSEIKAAIKQRTTVPDHLTVQVLKNKITSPEIVKSGFLLDGYPRTVEQAKLLIEHQVPIDKLLVVQSSHQALIDKLSSRWLDPDTGLFYDMRENPPLEEEVTARLIQRADDQEPVIRKRLETFFENISEIEKVMGHLMCKVDGDQVEDSVFEEIKAKLK